MHIRMQVRGSDKKRPQLAATACGQSNSYHCHSRINSHVESGYEEKKGMGRRGIILAPRPPIQPYQTVDRKRGTTTHADRDPGVQSGMPARWSAADGGMERTAGPADHSRSRRPIIMRGTRRVGARVVASGGDCLFFFFFFFFFFLLFFFPYFLLLG